MQVLGDSSFHYIQTRVEVILKNKAKQRYDSVKMKAVIDKDGFLHDIPVVARIGLQVYQTPDGPRREFRPASEVFAYDSVESYRGKPIVVGHHEVNSKNAKGLMVGACTGGAYRNWGDDEPSIELLCPVTVHDAEAIEQAQAGEIPELSVGYTTIDIERPGWGNEKTGEYFFKGDEPAAWKQDDYSISSDWVEFDALQTTIRVNHLAMVFRGRAGVAKLNLDAEQEFPYDVPVIEHKPKKDESMTVKIKLDGEVEHEVPEVVANHITVLTEKADSAQAKMDSLEAERDALKVKVDAIPTMLEEAKAEAKKDAESMAALIKTASEAGVKTDSLDAKAIKVAYVKAVMGTDISEKSDSYIDTAYDVAVSSDKMAHNRVIVGAEKSDEADKGALPDPQARFRK